MICIIAFNYLEYEKMKGIKYGIFIAVLFASLFLPGCSLTGGKQSTPGPIRGDNPISGDLTNADIKINDPFLFYAILGTGVLCLAGFLVLGYKVVQHHAAIDKIVPIVASK
jgi:hypothetical protein